MLLRSSCLVLAFFTLGIAAKSQVFDVAKDRVPMAVLDGLWRFHTGDDPRWADPGFDDSAWDLLRSDTGWSTQGYKNYGGMAWYRFQVILPDQHRQGLLMRRYDAAPGSAYLLRPDGYVAARFRHPTRIAIGAAMARASGNH